MRAFRPFRKIAKGPGTRVVVVRGIPRRAGALHRNDKKYDVSARLKPCPFKTTALKNISTSKQRAFQTFELCASCEVAGFGGDSDFFSLLDE
jgi:hypothetical protein